MAIPYAKDLISISRLVESDADFDRFDPDQPVPSLVTSGVRATISLPGGSATLVGGDRVVFSASMQCDVCDLRPSDTVTDANGTTWMVLTVTQQVGFGLDHLAANLRLVSGAAA